MGETRGNDLAEEIDLKRFQRRRSTIDRAASLPMANATLPEKQRRTVFSKSVASFRSKS